MEFAGFIIDFAEINCANSREYNFVAGSFLDAIALLLQLIDNAFLSRGGDTIEPKSNFPLPLKYIAVLFQRIQNQFILRNTSFYCCRMKTSQFGKSRR